MFQAQHLTKSFGDLVLFEDLSFSIERGEKIGLIARNGNGKTTLMNILTGIDSPDSGEVIYQNGIRRAYLPQLPQVLPGSTVLETCFGHNDEMTSLIARWEEASARGDGKRMEELLPEMDALGAWEYEQCAREILTRLHLDDLHRTTDNLSGGELKRIALAGTLIGNPELLFLDEPTNHLDLDVIEWLEGYLSHQQIGLLLVTHDRYFLDRVCNRILELDNKQLYAYKGNYEYYLNKREERLKATERETSRAANLLRREAEWMHRRPQARGTKAKSRIDAFYELKEKAQPRHRDETLHLSEQGRYIGNKIFEAHKVCKAFGDRTILSDFDYIFSRYDKVGIVGPNGVGKTTFLRLLLGEEEPDSGYFDVGETVRFGYYSQKGMQFDENKRVIEAVQDIAEVIRNEKDGTTLSASALLTQFLFPPEKQYTPIHKLSGGEQRRLYLCTVLMKNPNFLILDEPTNDLDILTLNVLENYLSEFKGCVLVVSHDRFFMDKVVNHLFTFEGNGIVKDFPGNYTQYREYKQQEEAERQTVESSPSTRKAESEKPRTDAAERPRKLTFKEKQELERLEAELPKLEKEKAELESRMSSGTMATDELLTAGDRIAALIEEIDSKGMRWLELSDI
ncbi:ABC-F family ATP-binding cassette domain-containing protein [Porphyromonas gingivalis]|uniref:ABC transporter ATP-binding protein n=1 Tax=Porphyromonas gingivalis (strain ATCC 33277 / DSM 20709 / CIP 103683 / JCM 12257 / NCTC 11834 / 2561) TaxID=431947 RepID=B2RKI7_PORG3|nr:ABC-F family ATP-binding cassette domain-containing protein [Porphyromonas gingivalis]AIJ35538.1 ABC transporter [Porphyromonas gingivalis]ALJ25803.1 ATPase component of ABC transporters with duplicated ATPase domain [Porphyromonas gingivalis 381]AUR49160.1 efflux pump complex or subunit confering antibiotic resistance [Porphyromonas gingivalis ATCC 33277]MDR4975155.1 ABC-F family ATP-binding cassette domain-containing protein [Porphyromonas gingivalis]SJL19983.1 ABC transporter [Porphyromo